MINEILELTGAVILGVMVVYNRRKAMHNAQMITAIFAWKKASTWEARMFNKLLERTNTSTLILTESMRIMRELPTDPSRMAILDGKLEAIATDTLYCKYMMYKCLIVGIGGEYMSLQPEYEALHEKLKEITGMDPDDLVYQDGVEINFVMPTNQD